MATKDGEKTGGRKKGTPNKRTTELVELLEAKNFNPVENILEALPQLEPRDAVKANLDLMGFVYPRKKAAEVNVEASVTREVSQEERDANHNQFREMFVEIGERGAIDALELAASSGVTVTLDQKTAILNKVREKLEKRFPIKVKE